MAQPGINNKTIYATFSPAVGGFPKHEERMEEIVVRGGKVNYFNNVLLISGAITITTAGWNLDEEVKERQRPCGQNIYTPSTKKGSEYMSAPLNHGLCSSITVRQQSKVKFSLPLMEPEVK